MSLYSHSVLRPLVMGILNVTPDSFYDGGRYLDPESAVRRGRQILDEGADLVDVGGESTRPGSSPVEQDEELARVVPVIEQLARDERVTAGSARISIDTTKPAVAEAAVAAGASILNDVSCSLEQVAAGLGAGYVAMHCQGTPADMQLSPHYDDVVSEVTEYLAEKARQARAAGVQEVWVDPGIGFGKTARHNLALLAELGRLCRLGWPVLVGTSRKAFIGRVAAGDLEGEPLGLSERFEGSLATAVWSMAQGASAVRVHDVAPSVQAARLLEASGVLA
jgi:dihydropteroate synthase